jgi:hypothetical protein
MRLTNIFSTTLASAPGNHSSLYFQKKKGGISSRDLLHNLMTMTTVNVWNTWKLVRVDLKCSYKKWLCTWASEVTEVVEQLPNKCEAWVQIPILPKKKKRKKW